MGFTNSKVAMKWWVPNTNKLKYCSSGKFDEHNNKFGKLWSPDYSLINVTNISAPPMLKLIPQTTPPTNMIYLRKQ